MGKTKIKTIDDSAPSEGRLSPNAASSRPRHRRGVPEASEGEPQGVSTEGAVSEQVSEATDQSESDEQVDSEPTPPKKSPKLGKTKPRSKKYLEASQDLDRTRSYPLPEALDMVKKMSYAKFNATLDISINTVQTGLHGFVSLPYASGKSLSILIFGLSQPQLEGVIFGTDSTLAEIEKGKVNFDLIMAAPEWMSKLARVAKVLGPKGLMPNPKNGTIVSSEKDLKKAVESFQSGKTEFKTEAKAPIIHLGLGKLDQPKEELEANVKTLLQTIGKTKIKKVVLSSTMGPAVRLDLASF